MADNLSVEWKYPETEKRDTSGGLFDEFMDEQYEGYVSEHGPDMYNKVRERMGLHGRLPSEKGRHQRGEENIYASEYGDQFGESTPDLDVVRGNPTMDELYPDARGHVVTKAGGSISGLQGLAYGGVPGQAYTEDIGMTGGLGAVAGPQLRFQGGGLIPHDQFVNSWMTPKVAMAYGGVPGQAYTEDIGMMGGLGAVAGPQLRFADAGGVEEVEEESVFKAGISPYGSLSMPQKGLSGVPVTDENGESVAFVQDIKDYFGIDDQVKEFEERRRLQYEKAPHTRKSIWDYYTKPRSDPSAIATKEKLAESTEALEKHHRDTDQSPKPEAEDMSGLPIDPTDMIPQLGSGIEDIKTKADDPPKVKKEKQKKQKEKWGPNWALISVGMNLMRGTEAGLKDASAVVKDMPTEGDKEMAKLKKEYLKAKTESEKAAASNKFLKMQWDREYKNTELGVKISQLDLNLQKQNWANVKTILEGMTEQQKMNAMNLTEQEAEELEDHPERAASILGRKHFKSINTIRQYLAGKEPFPTATKEPEEEETSWYEFWKKEGGAIPDSLRDAGVTSIRKI